MQIPLTLIDLPTNDLRARIDEDALDELADSLRDHGLLQPIGLKPTGNDRYEVVYGARRTRAAQQLGWTSIEAHIQERNSEQKDAAAKLIENVQRQDLTPIEEAYGLFALIGDAELSTRQLQKQTGKSRDWITNRLKLLDLPDDLQAAVQAGALGVGVATALGTIQDDEVRRQYVDHAIDQGITAPIARAWAEQAHYAATGIKTMRDHDTTDTIEGQEPVFVVQKWNCFSCAQPYDFRRVSTLVICSVCQDKITQTRPTGKQPE